MHTSKVTDGSMIGVASDVVNDYDKNFQTF